VSAGQTVRPKVKSEALVAKRRNSYAIGEMMGHQAASVQPAGWDIPSRTGGIITLPGETYIRIGGSEGHQQKTSATHAHESLTIVVRTEKAEQKT
jgi:hypothetical protein